MINEVTSAGFRLTTNPPSFWYRGRLESVGPALSSKLSAFSRGDDRTQAWKAYPRD